jgi:prevent-host-death family protein
MEVGVRQAKIDLSKLIKSALKGEKVVITNHGKPLAMIVPAQPRVKDKDRGYGMFKGQFTMPTDEEWKQMDREIEDSFYCREPGGK